MKKIRSTWSILQYRPHKEKCGEYGNKVPVHIKKKTGQDKIF
jgi:hypothetical protein